MVVGNTQLHDSIVQLNITDIATIASLVGVLDEHSKALASDEILRLRIGDGEPSIWVYLRRLWSMTAAAHSAQGDDEEDSGDGEHLRSLCYSLARFTRNVVAAVPQNQSRAFENEPSIRQLLHHYTSYTATSDERALVVTRMLAQTLSNIVTANEELITRLWGLYIDLPEEQSILIRLIAAADPGTTVAAFVFVLNSLNGSSTRMEILSTSRGGTRLCVTYLDRIATLFEAADKESSQAFEIGYRIFTLFLEEGILPELYARIGMHDEIVTPHQTTLLKLIDAYLQPSNSKLAQISNNYMLALCTMLCDAFFSFTSYTQNAIRRALGSNYSRGVSVHVNSPQVQTSGDTYSGDVDTNYPLDDGPPEELDLLLPKVCEALVLVTQGLISLALYSEERLGPSPVRRDERLTSRTDQAHFKDYVNCAVAPHGAGFIETLTETLRLLDLFLPRITFGKVNPPPVPAGHTPVDNQRHRSRHVDPKGFSYLKRDIVRLLGILASDRREVQDRVRACGGIPVVLNLCVIDDRNPYLREHAIFTIRNLLHGNAANQSVVHEIQPLGEWEKGFS